MRKSSAKVDHLDHRLLEMPDAGVLRLRLDWILDQPELDGFPRPMVARAVMAKGLDLSLAAGGMNETLRTAQRLLDLLGGRWSGATVRTFIESEHH